MVELILQRVLLHLLGTFEAEEGPFATGFDGEDINGPWTLSICDDAGGDVGTLIDFELTFLTFTTTQDLLLYLVVV